MDLDAIYRCALAAAHSGATVLRERFGRLTTIRHKGAKDLVTEADIGSEQAIVTVIRNAFPDHAIIAEESGIQRGKGKGRWLIDPLDGTTNFAHGLDLFSISIAFAIDDEIQVGIVLEPLGGALYAAIKGRGAWCNGRPIHVSTAATVAESLLVTGFPYAVETLLAEVMERLNACVHAAQGVRRLGSAALDLCHVACGRFEGFWEQNLKAWDVAAGALIAVEAGATVTDFANRPFGLDQVQLLATNGRIHQEMIRLLEVNNRG